MGGEEKKKLSILEISFFELDLLDWFCPVVLRVQL
jgi:hypothetical protein